MQQVRVEAGHVEIDFDLVKLAELLGLPAQGSPGKLTLTERMHLTRTGRVVRLVDGNGRGASPKSEEPSLTAMFLKARQWWDQLSAGNLNVKTLAREEGVKASWMTRVLPLAFLSPAVVEAMLEGELRAGVDAKALTSTGAVRGLGRAGDTVSGRVNSIAEGSWRRHSRRPARSHLAWKRTFIQPI